jgi:hypothetical protein
LLGECRFGTRREQEETFDSANEVPPDAGGCPPHAACRREHDGRGCGDAAERRVIAFRVIALGVLAFRCVAVRCLSFRCFSFRCLAFRLVARHRRMAHGRP